MKNEVDIVAMLLGVYDEELEKQAIREEREKVRKEERENAANVVIDIALGSGYSNEEILTTLQDKLGIKEKQAEEYLRKFYDKSLNQAKQPAGCSREKGAAFSLILQHLIKKRKE